MLAASETAAVMTSKGASDAACISKMDFNILHVWKGRWPGSVEREREAGEGRRGSRGEKRQWKEGDRQWRDKRGEEERQEAARRREASPVRCSLQASTSGGYCSCILVVAVAAVFYSRFLDVTLILLAMTMNIDVACGPLCMWPALAHKMP